MYRVLSLFLLYLYLYGALYIYAHTSGIFHFSFFAMFFSTFSLVTRAHPRILKNFVLQNCFPVLSSFETLARVFVSQWKQDQRVIVRGRTTREQGVLYWDCPKGNLSAISHKGRNMTVRTLKHLSKRKSKKRKVSLKKSQNDSGQRSFF